MIESKVENVNRLREYFLKKVGKGKPYGYLSIAHESGISYQVIMRFKNGKNISANNAIKLIKALQIPYNKL